MPKTKTVEKKEIQEVRRPTEELDKIIDLEEVAEVPLEDELVPGESEDDELEDEDAVLDEEEVDPFKDKWEE